MSITILNQSATIGGLHDQGTPAHSRSHPPSALSGIHVELEGAGNSRTGIWECSPGRFDRQLAQAEVMHILKGACSFTPTGGEPQEIRAGDSLFFPANTVGVWDVRETLRKLYVVLAE